MRGPVSWGRKRARALPLCSTLSGEVARNRDKAAPASLVRSAQSDAARVAINDNYEERLALAVETIRSRTGQKEWNLCAVFRTIRE